MLTIAITGYAGWRVWHENKDKNPVENAVVTNTSGESQDSESGTAYLEIKELGVKLKLVNDTKDMTYSMDADGNAILSSDSLSKEEPKCSADYSGSDTNGVNGVGKIASFTDPTGNDSVSTAEGTNIQAWPEAVLVSGKYYYVATNQTFCVNVGTKNSPTDRAFQIENTLVKALRSEILLEKL